MPNILFITWDGPQTTYMEGLFMPIFAAVQRSRPEYVFHVLQFTWAEDQRIAVTREAAESMGVIYSHCRISRRPHVTIGTAWTLFRAITIVKRYLEDKSIDVVMPRSTLPAIMINRLGEISQQVFFDADGLPIEERVDFSGLSRGSSLYKYLRRAEKKMLLGADRVITRSERSIEYHLDHIGERYRDKFSVVYNGRDSGLFKPSKDIRAQKRKELGFTNQDTVFVYCGSLGPQYGWQEMAAIVQAYREKTSTASRFLVLTGSPEYAKKHLPEALNAITSIRKVPFKEVPAYLDAADVAFAIRDPKPSMQGVAPIKLGEYLLMGLPTIASKGIGDTEALLAKTNACYLFDHNDPTNIAKAVDFLIGCSKTAATSASLREIGLTYFSLQSSSRSYLTALDAIY